ncbi:MAG: porin family protein [Nitratireductor sp.]|nr:porin family protein [Nitratireductor sp.]
MLANAADLIPPPVVEVVPEVQTIAVGGWYLRGDIGYSHTSVDGVLYYQGSPTLTGSFEKHDVGGAWMLGGGIGYQVNDYFRVDWTVDHHFWADFDGSSARGVACGVSGTCNYRDTSELAVTTLLANAYLDLGNFSGFTPYVGAGIGGAVVHWADLQNTETCVAGDCTGSSGSSNHDGNGEWRFAYALHGGVSYDLTANMKLDAGYTFKHIEGGHMFNFEPGNTNDGQQGFDGDIKIHTVRAGIRWNFM